MNYDGIIVDENIERMIALPALEKADLFKSGVIPLEEMKSDDPKLHEALSALHRILSTRFEYYVEDSHYSGFVFPETNFEPSAREWHLEVAVPKKQAAEDTFKDRMSPEQFAQIHREGTFLVGSNVSKMPYKWRVHPLIIKGGDNIVSDWYRDVARAYHQLRQVGKRINGDTLSLMLNLGELRLYPGRIGNMLVGLRQLAVDESPDYGRLLELRFMEHKFRSYFEKQPHQLYDELYAKEFIREYDARTAEHQRLRRRIEKLTQVDNKFEREWPSRHRALCKQYREDNPSPREDELRDLLLKQKAAAYHQALQEELPTSLQPEVFEFLRIFVTFNALRARLTRDRENARATTEASIQKEHKIRSLSPYFWREENDRRLAPIYKQLDAEYLESLKKGIGLPIFDEYLEFRDRFPGELEKLKAALPVTYKARRVFYTSYHLMPPFEVRKSHDSQGPTYSLKRVEEMQCDTGHHFWKFSLYRMRMVSWTRNCFFWLVVNAWVGPLGLKQLLTLGRYAYDHDINHRSGQMVYYYQNGLYLQFLNVLDGVRRSRSHFESLPDTGFFGKKFSRLYNLFECYVFRLVFVGIFLLLGAKPIAIVANTVLSLALAVTSWLWMPLVLVLTYLFNLLVYQFEIDEQHLLGRVSERVLPLINTPLMLVLNLVRIVAFAVGAAVVHPVLAALASLWAVLRRAYSTLTDEVDFVLIRLLARTPSTDSAIAWKVAGPAMSRSYYNSLSEEDVYLLVQAELEKRYLGQYRQQVTERIRIPAQQFEQAMRRILSLFEAGLVASASAEAISSSCRRLQANFDGEYAKYMRRYPTTSNLRSVRFTAEELEHNLDNAVRIVRKFVEKRQCPWLFSKASLDYGDYDLLTKNVLSAVFGVGVLEPLEDLDLRFELDTAHAVHRTAVLKALEGEVSLIKVQPRSMKSYRPFHVGDVTILKLGDVVQKIRAVCGQHVASTRDDMDSGPLINTNVLEIIQEDHRSQRYDKYNQELFGAPLQGQ